MENPNPIQKKPVAVKEPTPAVEAIEKALEKPATKRGRGRPKGSKNKPKVAPVLTDMTTSSVN